ncbi:MAG: 16S rRNA (cytidine(1402)-2'-O)-methyltransferase [Anaerolineales bacterium]|nr:16S rRNA (cytidine(1402)-2'-O)-methyltransferase [Anaerolineales bacterium]
MGTLYLVATPLGNLEDLSPRALRLLREVKLIAAEDTRHTGALLQHFKIETPLTSYFEHNKTKKLDQILNALIGGDVALVSDAGTPAINDPGYELVRAALAANFDVRPVPGPSAPISALSVSGLPTDSFLYLGYLPHKSGERKKSITQVAHLTYTLIFLESPHRLLDALEDLLAILGDRPICVAREMTKLYEEYWRGSINAALTYFKSKEPRGEFTLVIAGKPETEKERWPEAELLKAIKKELKNARPAKEISAELAEASGWNKKDVYSLINQLK